MSRRTVIQKRPVPPDPTYNSRLVSMMVRRIMQHGKKSVASSIVYDALKTIQERTGAEPLDLFEKAVKNATPLVEVKARRVGGATYQVPMEVRSDRGTTLSPSLADQICSRSRWPIDGSEAGQRTDGCS